jgi:hypothetical protein
MEHDKIIAKLVNGEKLNDVEQKYINDKLDKQAKVEQQARKQQAVYSLLIKYARAHYEPTDVEIDNEIKRLQALRDK